MNWYDSRLKKPSPNSAEVYPVIFLYCNSIFPGYCMYRPKNNYTDGDWGEPYCTNTNSLGGQVLYWSDRPNVPQSLLVSMDRLK